MPAGGTRLTNIFGGSLLIEFVRLVMVGFSDGWESLMSRDRGLNRGGLFMSWGFSMTIDLFIFALWGKADDNSLFNGNASSSCSLNNKSELSLFISCMFCIEVIESRLLLLPLLSSLSYIYKSQIKKIRLLCCYELLIYGSKYFQIN